MFSVHNLKVQKAWEAKEKEVKSYEDELILIKASFLDPSWIEETEKKIKGSKTNILQTEIEAKFNKIEARFTEEAAQTATDELHKSLGNNEKVGLKIENVGGEQSGRVI
jgi:hypothetical protein